MTFALAIKGCIPLNSAFLQHNILFLIDLKIDQIYSFREMLKIKINYKRLNTFDLMISEE